MIQPLQSVVDSLSSLHDGLTLLLQKLQPGPHGRIALPVQSDIFDHSFHRHPGVAQADRQLHPAQIALLIIPDAAGGPCHRRDHSHFFIVTERILGNAVFLTHLSDRHFYPSDSQAIQSIPLGLSPGSLRFFVLIRPYYTSLSPLQVKVSARAGCEITVKTPALLRLTGSPAW